MQCKLDGWACASVWPLQMQAKSVLPIQAQYFCLETHLLVVHKHGSYHMTVVHVRYPTPLTHVLLAKTIDESQISDKIHDSYTSYLREK